MNIGVVVDSDLVANIRNFSTGGRRRRARRPRRPTVPRARRSAVVAHVYYEDTWPDIAGALRGLTIPFDLIVTTVVGASG